MEQVSWDDCQQFLGKLNEKLGVGRGKFQLPTECSGNTRAVRRARRVTSQKPCGQCTVPRYVMHAGGSVIRAVR